MAGGLTQAKMNDYLAFLSKPYKRKGACVFISAASWQRTGIINKLFSLRNVFFKIIQEFMFYNFLSNITTMLYLPSLALVLFPM